MTNVIPTVYTGVRLPEDLRAKMDLHLFSEAEQRVPKGAHQRFISQLLREFFDSKSLDLAPYTGTLPETFKIRGSPRSVDTLISLLEERHGNQP